MKSEQTAMPLEGFVRLRQILQWVPVKKSTWWAGVQSGRFPKPLKLSPGVTVWRVQDIRRFVEQVG
jgi:prophage regulatory protein